MRIVAEKSAIAGALNIVRRGCGTNNYQSVLSNVKVKGSETSVTFTTFDTKTTIRASFPADVSEPSEVLVPVAKFLDALKTLPSGELILEDKDGVFVIRPSTGKAKFKLKTMAADKFPEVALDLPGVAFFEFPGSEFGKMIEATAFAVSDDETRYFMNGCYLARESEGLVMAATDGRRLARSISEAPTPEFKPVIMIPPFLALAKEFAGEGPIELAITDKFAAFRAGNVQAAGLLIEGQFPNYRKVIPESQKSSFVVNRQELLDAIKRAAAFTDARSGRIHIEIEPGSLKTRSEAGENGSSEDEIPCIYDGEPFVFALNFKYLLDVAERVSGSELRVEFSEPNRALSFPDGRNLHVVMPMQLE